jgi:hypothetical protein
MFFFHEYYPIFGRITVGQPSENVHVIFHQHETRVDLQSPDWWLVTNAGKRGVNPLFLFFKDEKGWFPH